MSVSSMPIRRKPASEVIYLAFSGLVVMGAVAAVEGIISGALLGVAEFDGSGIPRLAAAAAGGAICAMVIGAPVGLICWGIIAQLCRAIPDEAVERAQLTAMKGSAFGVAMGGLLGMLLAPLMPARIEAPQGYVIGVMIGFIFGTMFGGIGRTRMEICEYEPYLTPPADPVTDDDASLLVDVTRYLDQVHVRVTEIDRGDRPESTGTTYGAFDDPDAEQPKVIHHILGRRGGDETEIGGAGGGTSRFRLELSPDLMQVDLLVAEGERLPSITKGDRPHPERAGIELTGCADISNRENEMVDGQYALPSRLT